MIFFVGFVRVSYFFLRWGKEAVGLIPVNNNVKKIITSSIQPVNGKVPPGSCVKVGLGSVAPQLPMPRRFLWLRTHEDLPPSASLTIKNV